MEHEPGTDRFFLSCSVYFRIASFDAVSLAMMVTGAIGAFLVGISIWQWLSRN